MDDRFGSVAAYAQHGGRGRGLELGYLDADHLGPRTPGTPRSMTGLAPTNGIRGAPRIQSTN